MKQTEDLRRTLLESSLALISSEGLEAFSMREVARRAGVSHQAPYHHFADREGILAAIVSEGFQQLRAEMLAALGQQTDPAERLIAIGKAYVRFALKRPAHFKLMFRSELVRPDKNDEAKACAQAAFALLVSTVDDVAVEKYDQTKQTLVVMAWSLAHGLATLLLEGKLDDTCGKGKRAQAAAAEAALTAFGALLRRQ